VRVTASIGVAIYPLDDTDGDALLRHADHAMYQAKKDGKHRFRLHERTEHLRLLTEKTSLERFKTSLANDELVLYFQPRIDLRSGTLAGCEALLRWPLPKGGMALPEKFFPLIATREQAIAVDRWVLRNAIQHHLVWLRNGSRIPISINLGGETVQDETFPDYLSGLLAECPAGVAESIEFEVLETCVLRDSDRVARIMYACIDQGVTFSLDDFGTGYSSLSYFHRLPISLLKLDHSFVSAMLDHPKDQDIVEGVLHLANSLGRPVVAEGVEHLESGMMLLQLGCQYAQGYGVSRPLPATRVPSWEAQFRRNRDWQGLRHCESGPTTRCDLNVAMRSHERWMLRFRQYCESGRDFLRPEIDPDTCQVARWCRGIGAARYGDRPSFGPMQRLHGALLARTDAFFAQFTELSSDMRERTQAEISRTTDEFAALLAELAEG
jgi:EAL domain-containing protein (putative c-di-GMP-specific phosphodiesterase class I)